MLTNASGQKVQGYLYTPYGETWITEDTPDVLTSEIMRLFTGQMLDKETGLYYMNARYYDPKVGVFISTDPSLSGMNHYAYASTNPIKYTDPTGLKSKYGVLGDQIYNIIIDNQIAIFDGKMDKKTVIEVADLSARMIDNIATKDALSFINNIYSTYNEYSKAVKEFSKEKAKLWDKMLNNLYKKDKENEKKVNIENKNIKEKINDLNKQELEAKKEFMKNIREMLEKQIIEYINNLKEQNKTEELNKAQEIYDKVNKFYEDFIDNIDSNRTQDDHNKDSDFYFCGINNGIGFSSYGIGVGIGTGGMNGSGAGAGNGSTGGASVICTELHRQGLMDDKTYKADEEFGKYLRKTNPNIMTGYHFLAKPVVKLMQKYKFITNIIYFITTPWTKEMGYRMGNGEKGSFAGKIIMSIGIVVCGFIGKILELKLNIFFILNIILLFIIIIIELAENMKKKKFYLNTISKEKNL